MAADLSPQEERRGTRKLMIWGIATGAVLLIGVSLWPLLPSPQLGRPRSGDGTENVGVTERGTPAQRAAESASGKNDAARPEDATGGKARAIKETNQELSLDTQQRQKLRQIISTQGSQRVDRADFELMIGAAVPRQVELQALPQEASTILGGYSGDEYLLVQDRLVVVDHQSRRVVAIIPQMG